MALSDKNILITPNRGQTADPKIDFVGANATVGPQTITMQVYPTSNGTISFSGTAGELFSITNNLTGTIFSVNDVSGIPSIEVEANGLITLAEFGGNVGIGNAAPTDKLSVTGTLFVSGNANVGNLTTTRVISSGNVSATQFISNIATGTAPFVVTSTTTVANLSVANATYATSATSAGSATTAGTVTTNAQPNITSVSTSFTGLTFAGNGNITMSGSASQLSGANLVSANFISGNGSSLTAINASSITSGTLAQARLANSSLTVNGTSISLGGTGTVTANTTQTLTLGSYLTGTSFNGGTAVTAAVDATTTNTASKVVARDANGSFAANIITATLSGSATTAGTVTGNAQGNITSVGTLSTLAISGTGNVLTVTGNVALTGTIISGFGNGLAGVTSAKSAVLDVTDNANYAIALIDTTGSPSNIYRQGTGSTGFLYNPSTKDLDVGSISGTFYPYLVNVRATTAATSTTTGAMRVQGGMGVAGNIYAGAFYGPATGLTSIPGANVTGTVSSATSATTASTVTANAQGNITSVGTLTSLSVSGNALVSGNLTVDGSLVYVNVDTLAVEDPIINLGTGPNGAAPAANAGKDVGTALNYFDTAARVAFMGWDVSNAEFGLASVASISGEVVTFTTYGNLRVGNIIGNGQALTSMNGANVIGTVANATYAASAGSVASATTAGTVTTNAQPNITSVSTSFTGLTFAANGNITMSGSLSQISGANLISATNLTGTLTTAAQTNITSVGTLGSLTVTGNVSVGNIIGNGQALTGINASNISSGTLAQARLANSSLTVNGTAISLGGSGTITANTTQTLTLGTYLTGTSFNGGTAVTAAVDATTTNTASKVVARDANGSFAANIITATLSGSATSATTAGTVTTNAQGNITSVGTLTGLTANGNVTINQNAAEVFTVSARQAPTSDMVSITNSGQAITTAGVNLVNLTFVGGAAAVEASAYRTDFTPGATSGGTWNGFRFVAASNAASGVTMNAIKIDNITGGAGTENMIRAGTGWDNILNYNGTSVIYGNGKVNGSEVVGTVANATYATSAGTAGTVTTNAQPNITSVSTSFTGLTFAANGNITMSGSASQISGGNLVSAGFISGNGSLLTALNASNISSGTLAQARLANSSLTVNGTAIALGSTGTITANTTQTLSNGSYITGDTFNGGTARTWAVDATTTNTASKVVARDANGSFAANIITATLSGSATTAGTVTTNAQPNITSVGTLTSLTVSNDIVTSGLIANSATGRVAAGTDAGGSISIGRQTASTTATPYIDFNTSATPVDFDVRIQASGNTSTIGGGTLTITAATTNVSAALNVAGVSNLGPVGNVTITGGTNGQVLTTNGSGVLSWSTPSGGGASISNGTSNVNIATSGGNITMGVGGTANVVTVSSSNVRLGTGTGGNISGANVVTANVFISSVATGVSAAGTTQGTATALASQISVVSTVASGAGVRLPTAIAGMRFTIVNTSANALLVYPATSGIINSQAANAAYSQPAGARLDFISTTTTQWYTLNATYG